MEAFRHWQVGTIGGRGEVLLTGLPFLVVGVVLGLACARSLNALALAPTQYPQQHERIRRASDHAHMTPRLLEGSTNRTDDARAV